MQYLKTKCFCTIVFAAGDKKMLGQVYHLVDVCSRLEEALLHLREQHRLTRKLDRMDNHFFLLMLLSSSLRSFCWLEGRCNDVMAQICESLP